MWNGHDVGGIEVIHGEKVTQTKSPRTASMYYLEI
jgi:hypothetical protein